MIDAVMEVCSESLHIGLNETVAVGTQIAGVGAVDAAGIGAAETIGGSVWAVWIHSGKTAWSGCLVL